MNEPTIDVLLQSLVDEGRGDSARLAHLLVGRGIIDEATAWLHAQHPARRHLVVCDAHTFAAAGEKVVAALQAVGADVETLVLSPGDGDAHLVCDDHLIGELETRLRANDALNPVAVGAGTVTDIVKMASHRAGRRFQGFATAASMNGYTSAIAAVLSRGVKRTLPTSQAEAIFADLDVVAAAPAYLNQAGFGDLLSKPFSTADWMLSHLVRGVEFHERPAQLLDDAYTQLISQAAGVGKAEPEAIGTLTRTIVLSGFTMALAGTSAPASGGEHLVSHYWDMEQHCQGQELFGLHGAQVGVATRISAMLFERLLELDASDIDPDACAAKRPGPIDPARVAAQHPHLTDDVIGEVSEQFAQKQRHGQALRDEIAAVRDRWPEVQDALSLLLIPAREISDALAAAGAADRPTKLGVTPEHAVHTVQVCRQIRGRYVALDLMADLGRLDEWAADAVAACEG
ncbi:MAG: hypothetical protein DRJ42_17440 [Deltaproteobacteria bacterium]|nr:MAG: hypothetical protein DRJ42_17440 [Deltaproteobacteria bacterium]